MLTAVPARFYRLKVVFKPAQLLCNYEVAFKCMWFGGMRSFQAIKWARCGAGWQHHSFAKSKTAWHFACVTMLLEHVLLMPFATLLRSVLLSVFSDVTSANGCFRPGELHQSYFFFGGYKRNRQASSCPQSPAFCFGLSLWNQGLMPEIIGSISWTSGIPRTSRRHDPGLGDHGKQNGNYHIVYWGKKGTMENTRETTT